MVTRRDRLVGEAVRFLAVGGLATIVALIIFNLLVHGFNTGDHSLLANQPIVAYILANTVGMVISYRGSRSYAFRDRPPRHADGGRTAYVIINVATMALPVACLVISRDVLGLSDPVSDNVSANVVGLAMGLAARFYLFRTFVFRRPIVLTEIYTADLIDGPREPVEPPASLASPAVVTVASTDPSSGGPIRRPAPGAAGD